MIKPFCAAVKKSYTVYYEDEGKGDCILTENHVFPLTFFQRGDKASEKTKQQPLKIKVLFEKEELTAKKNQTFLEDAKQIIVCGKDEADKENVQQQQALQTNENKQIYEDVKSQVVVQEDIKSQVSQVAAQDDEVKKPACLATQDDEAKKAACLIQEKACLNLDQELVPEKSTENSLLAHARTKEEEVKQEITEHKLWILLEDAEEKKLSLLRQKENLRKEQNQVDASILKVKEDKLALLVEILNSSLEKCAPGELVWCHDKKQPNKWTSNQIKSFKKEGDDYKVSFTKKWNQDSSFTYSKYYPTMPPANIRWVPRVLNSLALSQIIIRAIWMEFENPSSLEFIFSSLQ